jgi:hypothetical protein
LSVGHHGRFLTLADHASVHLAHLPRYMVWVCVVYSVDVLFGAAVYCAAH